MPSCWRSSRSVVDALFTALSNIPETHMTTPADPLSPGINALSSLSPKDKQLFVTLHCIFPNELLPALDLLDRRLMTRFERDNRTALYYVRSTQTSQARRHRSIPAVAHSYEVRLTAWNCGCPAFALAAFNAAALPDDSLSQDSEAQAVESCMGRDGGFGGCSLRDRVPPVCKHLLACYLVERCPLLLGGYVDVKIASIEEMAAWAAGWGD